MNAVPAYHKACWLFVRALAILFFGAFASLAVQVRGLIGAQGILPVGAFLGALRNDNGALVYRTLPTIFWLNSSDAALLTACAAGAVISLLLLFGIWERAALIALFVLYLSYFSAGQAFLSFQWDLLLLEAGFLAIFLKPDRARVFLFQWLLFRLMFESGMVKLLSHDVTWRGLTAMTYHYLTQPLPTPFAWYLYQAPLWFQTFSTGFVFFVELLVPFLIFGPRLLRYVAAALMVLLQTLILLTGNYAFFNVLAIALCLFLLDDSALPWVRMPKRRPSKLRQSNRWVTSVVFGLVMLLSGLQMGEMFDVPMPAGARSVLAAISPYGVMNTYGLFANMTTKRLEIEIQGSKDAVTWTTYPFRYKPGPLTRAPVWAEPHQPRLDWQMWFAALGAYQQNPWFAHLLEQLLRGSPPVLGLLERDPFNGKPPKYIRALLFEYQFSDFAKRRATGEWWTREPRGEYFPAVSLGGGK